MKKVILLFLGILLIVGGSLYILGSSIKEDRGERITVFKNGEFKTQFKGEEEPVGVPENWDEDTFLKAKKM